MQADHACYSFTQNLLLASEKRSERSLIPRVLTCIIMGRVMGVVKKLYVRPGDFAPRHQVTKLTGRKRKKKAVVESDALTQMKKRLMQYPKLHVLMMI